MSYETEEQQIERLKEWWRDNGTPLVIGAVLGLAGFGGWKYWNSQQVAYQAAASDLYNKASEIQKSEKQEGLKDSLVAVKDKYPESSYAVFSALHLAKIAVEANDYDKAATELTWVLDNHSGNELVSIAKIRLARVLIQQEKPAEALSLLAFDEDSGYKSLASLVKGDALAVLGRNAEAVDAYKIASLDKEVVSRHPSLEFKIEALSNPDASVSVDVTPDVSGDESAEQGSTSSEGVSESEEVVEPESEGTTGTDKQEENVASEESNTEEKTGDSQ